MRLRTERPNHVCSYDFVEEHTHDGRKYRMLNIVDEFACECLAIRIDRKLDTSGVLHSAPECILNALDGHIYGQDRPDLHQDHSAASDKYNQRGSAGAKCAMKDHAP